MKKYTLLSLIFIAFILFQACDTSAKSNVNSTGQLLKGYYVYGHEVNTFQPCGTKKIYWITSSNETLKILIQGYEENISEPYEEVFVQLIGKFVGKASDGFAMDYDGQVFANKIVTVKKKSTGDCS